MNRKNLKKLAGYLLSDKLKADFDMSEFSECSRIDRYCEIDTAEPNCGSVGCAIGHGPYAGIIKEEYEPWHTYVDRAFDFRNHGEKTWCFGASWVNVDNTAEGAGKRINWLLEKGLPHNWLSQIKGTAILCYL